MEGFESVLDLNQSDVLVGNGYLMGNNST
jgi:hypothetical protein